MISRKAMREQAKRTGILQSFYPQSFRCLARRHAWLAGIEQLESPNNFVRRTQFNLEKKKETETTAQLTTWPEFLSDLSVLILEAWLSPTYKHFQRDNKNYKKAMTWVATFDHVRKEICMAPYTWPANVQVHNINKRAEWTWYGDRFRCNFFLTVCHQ